MAVGGVPCGVKPLALALPVLALPVLALLVLAAPARADGPVRLQPGRALFMDAQGTPRVTGGTAKQVRARINAALAAADARLRAGMKECMMVSSGLPDGPPSTWQRTVSVTQAGPRWLSVLVSDDFYCGGAHPNNDVFPLVFDLRTGRPPDWTRLLPPALAGEAALDTAGDGSPVGLVRSPALLQLARGAARPDCKDVLDADSGRFVIWPEQGGLTAVIFGLAHVVQACADGISLPPARLRALGGAALADTLAPARRAPAPHAPATPAPTTSAPITLAAPPAAVPPAAPVQAPPR